MRKLIIIAFLTILSTIGYTQDSAIFSNKIFSAKGFNSLNKKTISTTKRIEKQSNKYLLKFRKQEKKLYKEVYKKDSLLANRLFENVRENYNDLKNGKLVNRNYFVGHLDSLTTALHFINQGNNSNQKVNAALSNYSILQSKYNKAEQINIYISQRKKLLKESLQQLGLIKKMNKLQKDAYYFSAQLKECKKIFETPSEVEKRILKLVVGSKEFNTFYRKNSQLRTLFGLPGNADVSSSMGSLQTRSSINNTITQRFGSSRIIAQHLRQNMQNAQSQLNQLKIKASKFGIGMGGNIDDLPKNFTPNSQKTKTFFQRFEYGGNVQTQKAQRYFPVTTDIALSLGYKLNDKSSIGIGSSLKIGFGSSFQNFNLSYQGIGMRTYVDFRIKKGLFLYGGYEMNYRSTIKSISDLSEFSSWAESGLAGISKKYKVSKRLNGSIQLLWDYLSYKQKPRTSAILFRIGYTLR